MGFASLYPGKASLVGLFALVIVSPTFKSDTFLTLAAIYPTSPAVNSLAGVYFPGSR
jgi:hypothetical protein